jgi:CRP-like cAMP-binding protein
MRPRHIDASAVEHESMHYPSSQSKHDATPTSHGTRAYFLASLTHEERNVVIAAASRRSFAAHTVVTNASDPAERLFLLVSGQARYFVINEEGQQLSFQWLFPGDIFGGAALLPTISAYLASTEIMRPSEVLVWPRAVIRRLAKHYPQLYDNGLSVASEYFVWFIAAHVALACDSARKRLSRVLTTLSAGLGQPDANGALAIELNNEQLATASNLTKFTVSRILKDWRLSGAIAKQRGKLVLYRPDLLA